MGTLDTSPLIFAGPGITAAAQCSRPVELLVLYPTLLDLCGLPARDNLEGHTLTPLLKDPDAERPWPALTTHNRGNHAVRTDQWRYIRYADGSEELYDLEADPDEWKNLAALPAHEEIKRDLAAWMPRIEDEAPPVPGSAFRLLTYENGQAVWEGKPIPRGAAMPED